MTEPDGERHVPMVTLGDGTRVRMGDWVRKKNSWRSYKVLSIKAVGTFDLEGLHVCEPVYACGANPNDFEKVAERNPNDSGSD